LLKNQKPFASSQSLEFLNSGVQQVAEPPHFEATAGPLRRQQCPPPPGIPGVSGGVGACGGSTEGAATVGASGAWKVGMAGAVGSCGGVKQADGSQASAMTIATRRTAMQF
jgi:hypothetical protein